VSPLTRLPRIAYSSLVVALLTGGCDGRLGHAISGNSASPAPLVIKIGIDLPLSGIDSASAIPVLNAMRLAIEEANARGLPGGAHLEISDLDDTIQGKHDPAQGALNAKAFVDDDSVVVMLGPMNSSVAKAQIPVTSAAGLAQISPAATALELTQGADAAKMRAAGSAQPTFFRVCANDARGGTALADFARSLHFARVFIVDDNESYGKGLADVFETAFSARGGTVLGHEHLTPLQLDFKALLTKIGALRPDAVFFGGVVGTGGGIFRKQMGDAGLGSIPYLGGDGLLSPEYVPLAGKAADGTYFAILSPNIERLAAARSFVSAYRARFGSSPTAYGTAGYAAAEVAVAAIRRELAAHPDHVPTRSALAHDLAAAPPYPSAVGPVAFDAAGDLRAPVVSLYRVSGGRTVFIAQVATR
jgi:branched-chain amino acid transport system substrate-binding protein